MFKKKEEPCKHRILVLEYHYDVKDVYICLSCEARIIYSTIPSVEVQQ